MNDTERAVLRVYYLAGLLSLAIPCVIISIMTTDLHAFGPVLLFAVGAVLMAHQSTKMIGYFVLIFTMIAVTLVGLS